MLGSSYFVSISLVSHLFAIALVANFHNVCLPSCCNGFISIRSISPGRAAKSRCTFCAASSLYSCNDISWVLSADWDRQPPSSKGNYISLNLSGGIFPNLSYFLERVLFNFLFTLFHHFELHGYHQSTNRHQNLATRSKKRYIWCAPGQEVHRSYSKAKLWVLLSSCWRLILFATSY